MTKDFENGIAQIARNIEQNKEYVPTEDTTKISFVLPFIRLLGYNCTDPREVQAEFTADEKDKNMDKVDYVIMENGKPIILIECKHWSEKLERHVGQLKKYFHSLVETKFAILTNGIEYLFFTDLEKANILDRKAFLKINMLDLKAHAIKELAKFRKENFNVSEILTTAEELKYTSSIFALLNEEYRSPSDDFVKFILTKVYDGVKVQSAVEKFRPLINNSFEQFVKELISERLEAAKPPTEEPTQPEPTKNNISDIEENVDGVPTLPTEEELQAYYIVKGILAEAVKTTQIYYKDTASWLSIIYDNKSTKWVCRIILRPTSKVIHFPPDVRADKIILDSVDDLYKHKKLLLQSVKKFLD